MDEAINNILAQYAIENANLRLQLEQLRLANERLSEEAAKQEDSTNGKLNK